MQTDFLEEVFICLEVACPSMETQDAHEHILVVGKVCHSLDILDMGVLTKLIVSGRVDQVCIRYVPSMYRYVPIINEYDSVFTGYVPICTRYIPRELGKRCYLSFPTVQSFPTAQCSIAMTFFISAVVHLWEYVL